MNNIGAQITAHTATGHSIGGGVSDLVATVQDKGGYTGQLYDPASLSVTPAIPEVDETATRQFSATSTMDDSTDLVLSPSDLTWSVLLGPLTGVDAAGLATADVVYEDTLSTVQGDYLTLSNTADLTVLDTISDNFGAYAADSIGDDWQFTYFGNPPNADAAPSANPDGDPHDNLFEFLTGYNPIVSTEFFTFKIASVTGTNATLELSKVIPGTRYRIERSSDLGQTEPWSEIMNFTTASEVLEHPITDPAADPISEFYRISVEVE